VGIADIGIHVVFDLDFELAVGKYYLVFVRDFFEIDGRYFLER